MLSPVLIAGSKWLQEKPPCFLHCSWPRVCSTWTHNCLVQVATCRGQPYLQALHHLISTALHSRPHWQCLTISLPLSLQASCIIWPLGSQIKCHFLWNDVLIDNILLETYPTLLFSKVLPVYKVPSNSITISTTKMWFHQSLRGDTIKCRDCEKGEGGNKKRVLSMQWSKLNLRSIA